MSSTNTHRQETTVRRMTRYTVNAVLIAVVLGCFAWLAPSLFGYSRYVITGGSMTGSISKGSVVFEKPVAVEDLKVGDVITYLPPSDSGVSDLVTHRIVDMAPAEGGGTLFRTQGDANPQPDPWRFELTDDTQPVVVFDVPKVGWIFVALADRETRMMLIGGPAALIALLALAQLVGAVRGRSDDDGPAVADSVAFPAQRTADESEKVLVS